jgi:PAB-dependent poly(A)-specific ribonuclease subunit 3
VKLFRDYVFHQCDENGHPIVDLGHVTECLNKLDVSADEKVLMMSRDGQNLLVASFADLKRSFDNAFADLVQNSR